MLRLAADCWLQTGAHAEDTRSFRTLHCEEQYGISAQHCPAAKSLSSFVLAEKLSASNGELRDLARTPATGTFATSKLISGNCALGPAIASTQPQRPACFMVTCALDHGPSSIALAGFIDDDFTDAGLAATATTLAGTCPKSLPKNGPLDPTNTTAQPKGCAVVFQSADYGPVAVAMAGFVDKPTVNFHASYLTAYG